MHTYIQSGAHAHACTAISNLKPVIRCTLTQSDDSIACPCYYAVAGKNRTYNLKETLFPKVSFIDIPLLEDVIRCYKDRQTVCRNCFCNDLKLSRGYDAEGKCTQCQWEFKKLLVIPKSPMTVNFYKSEMIAIPPWPKSKPNELPFESCAKPTDKSKEHKRCLIMSRNSAVWYAHTVEELVIWTVERERGKLFSYTCKYINNTVCLWLENLIENTC